MCVMEQKIQSQIVDLFSLFDDFELTLSSRIKECQKLVLQLFKYKERYNLVKSAAIIKTPLADFTDLKEKLLFELHCLLLENVDNLKEQYCIFKDFHKKLNKKKCTLFENCKKIDFDSESKLVNGTSLQPSLSKILEYSIDIVSYCAFVCSQLEFICNFNTLNKTDLSNITELLKIDSKTKTRINFILAIGELTKENEI